MRDLLEYIVKNLVNHPDDVNIKEDMLDTENLNLSLKVNSLDMGLVIGKNGQTIKAIRKLLITRAMAEGQNMHINLSLEE